jgi:hypothetical protein
MAVSGLVPGDPTRGMRLERIQATAVRVAVEVEPVVLRDGWRDHRRAHGDDQRQPCIAS